MILSDMSVRRPVVAAVMSLILVACGVVSFQLLPLRQYPDIDPPIVSIETMYPGAAANVVETRVTELIEERVSGIEGIETIESVSEDGQSTITLTFVTTRDPDAAANDVRDRVAGVLSDLPEEADPPEVTKVDANQDVVIWVNLTGDQMSMAELTDYAERYLVDRFARIEGVARVQIGGRQSYAMRIWLDRQEMAARDIVVADVEARLRAENLELPAGSIESVDRQLTVRVDRMFSTPDDFARLVIAEGRDGYLVRLGDIARVELGTVESRTFFRGNLVPNIGLGIIRQSTANTVAVARATRAEAAQIGETLPEGMSLEPAYDTSVFIESAITEVYVTLAIAVLLVVFVIFLFLGSLRATLIPAVTVPVSLIGAFFAMQLLGFSINLLTLLALVLAIGLVVDDAIVVLENIFRRMDEGGETPLVAAYEGARQVGFAVVATTVVLIAVFTPIAFLQGDVGRLFSEFALTMAAAVAISSFVALTLCPALASKVLKPRANKLFITRIIDAGFARLRAGYAWLLRILLKVPVIGLGLIAAGVAGSVALTMSLPSEYAPREDRGVFFVIVTGPEGATHDYMARYMDEIERRMTPYVEVGEVQRLLVRSPNSFGNFETFNSGIVISVLSDWDARRGGFEIMAELNARLADLPGVRAFPVMPQGFGGGPQMPVQMTIGGGSWEQLAEWRDTLLEAIAERELALGRIDWDYRETAPQLRVDIDYDQAATLGVSLANIGRTLETMFGSRRVTTFMMAGEEYDVMLEGERDLQRSPAALTNIHVRSDRTGALIPLSTLVTLREAGGSSSLNRFNRVRAITIEAGLPPGRALGDALDELEALAREVLPPEVVIDFKGESRDIRQAGESMAFIFAFGAGIVFLVLAAQFESVRHPLVIMLSVPVAIVGGLLALRLTGLSLNLYSQIGLIMLIGLAAKNGILVVEFANQLRDRGQAFREALYEASLARFRPIVMTGVTTIAGSIPLILSSGAGQETRFVMGVVIFGGVLVSTFVALITVPTAYALLARGTQSPGTIARRLDAERKASPLLSPETPAE